MSRIEIVSRECVSRMTPTLTVRGSAAADWLSAAHKAKATTKKAQGAFNPRKPEETRDERLSVA
jgi:hypothetical protein